jgi:hypothetical protein
VELRDVLERRRDGSGASRDVPVDESVLRSLCVDALLAPTAGNTGGVDLVDRAARGDRRVLRASNGPSLENNGAAG